MSLFLLLFPQVHSKLVTLSFEAGFAGA